ncbi:MAG: LD-carboxypeptidase [Candidatus Glassbacteria bacterium]|nr:LD-carboxypeptidase [Candidatus Glassbacteria bacterium]
MPEHPIKPPRLKAGDTIGLVAPASPLLSFSDIDRAKRVLGSLGFAVAEGDHIRSRHGFLAGEDRLRAGDLEKMFADRKVRGIFALRGGYGSARLLDLLDWELIAANPKVLLGHSDLTALLLAVYQRAGMVTFWGPLAGYDLGRTSTPFKLKWLQAVLCDSRPGLRLPQGPPGRRWRTIRRAGTAEGRLVGGNLSLLCSLLGTPFEPDTAGALLFFEDVDEEPYRFDRMLGQLAMAGKLARAAGIVVGKCVNCEPQGRMRHSFRLHQVLQDRLGGLDIPVVYGTALGHEADKITLPIGIRARLDIEKGNLTLLEPAVG